MNIGKGLTTLSKMTASTPRDFEVAFLERKKVELPKSQGNVSLHELLMFINSARHLTEPNSSLIFQRNEEQQESVTWYFCSSLPPSRAVFILLLSKAAKEKGNIKHLS